LNLPTRKSQAFLKKSASKRLTLPPAYSCVLTCYGNLIYHRILKHQLPHAQNMRLYVLDTSLIELLFQASFHEQDA
jgi:hypothetical protein